MRCLKEKLESIDVCPEITGSRNAYEVDHTQIITAIGQTIIDLSIEQEKFNITTFKQVSRATWTNNKRKNECIN